MTEDNPPEQTCTALVPYQPHFFPIPWKSSNGGRFTLAQLQPIELPTEDADPPPTQTPNPSPRLPPFELNLKVAKMLARRATIMSCLNGNSNLQAPIPPEGVAPATSIPAIPPRLARSQSTSTLLATPRTLPSTSSSQQLPPALPPSTSSTHSRFSFTQDVTADDELRSMNSPPSANPYDLAVAPPSSQLSYQLYEDEEDEMIPGYSQDYIMQDEDDQDSLTALGNAGYMDLELGEDLQEYEEETLNGLDQPYAPIYYEPYGQDEDYQTEARLAQPYAPPAYLPGIEFEEAGDTIEDTTNPRYGHFEMRYEDYPLDAGDFVDLNEPDYATHHDEPQFVAQEIREADALVQPLEGEDLESVDEPVENNQETYNPTDSPEEATVPGYNGYIPEYLDEDPAVELDTTMEDTEQDDHYHSPQPSYPKQNPSIAQWRVGKVAGHQGSYLKRVKEDQNGKDGPRGTKRTLNGDIEQTVQRVLKKPFVTPRPVAKPHNAKGPDLIDLSDGEDDPALSPPSVPKSRKPAPFPLLTPTTKSSAIKASARLSKPFKTPAKATPSSTSQTSPSKSSTGTPASTPFDRSVAPSPTTHLGSSTAKLMSSTPVSNRTKRSSPSGVVLLPSSTSNSTPAQADKTKLANLEKRLRQLQKAVKYQTNPDEEDKVSSLTEQWLVAGRDIAERLFDRLPKPDDLTPAQAQSFHWGMAKTGGWNSRDRQMDMTDEERGFYKNVSRDEDGDPVDDEGNKLVEDINEGQILSALGGSGRGGAYKPSMMGIGRYADEGEMNGEKVDLPESSSPTTLEWTIGTMLLRLGIEPSLLGWDAENEMWIEGEF